MLLGDQMVRMQKHRPSFFKIMLGDFAHHLRIPPAFVKQLNVVPSRKVSLKVSTGPGRRWIVKLEKVKNGLSLKEGWGCFRVDNSIEFGDLLVFISHGDSEFYVKIYTKSGCEKKRNLDNLRRNVAQHASCSSQRTFAGKFAECAIPQKRRVTGTCLNSIPSPAMGRAVLQEKRAYEQALQSKSSYPFFIIKLGPTYLQKKFLAIPLSFSEKYLPKQSQIARIFGPDGRTWPVNYTFGCTASLCRGWDAIVLGNNLKEKHFCAFELIDNPEVITLKLSVLNA